MNRFVLLGVGALALAACSKPAPSDTAAPAQPPAAATPAPAPSAPAAATDATLQPPSFDCAKAHSEAEQQQGHRREPKPGGPRVEIRPEQDEITVTGAEVVAHLISAGVEAGADPVEAVREVLPRLRGAFALAIAAAELAYPIRIKTPQEPTRSLGAIAIVLLARQMGDGARFAVFAVAAWTVVPLTAGLGGALGGAAAVAVGWSVGSETLARWPLRIARLVLAGCLALAALFIGLNARYPFL